MGGRSRRGHALPGADARPRPPAPPARSLSLNLKHHSALRPACSAPGRSARTAGLGPARRGAGRAAPAKHRLVAEADRTEPNFNHISCKGAGQRCCKGAGQRGCGGEEGAAAPSPPPAQLARSPFPHIKIDPSSGQGGALVSRPRDSCHCARSVADSPLASVGPASCDCAARQ